MNPFFRTELGDSTLKAFLQTERAACIFIDLGMLSITQAAWTSAFAEASSDSDLSKDPAEGNSPTVNWSNEQNGNKDHEISKTDDSNALRIPFKNVYLGDKATSSTVGVEHVSKYKSEFPHFESTAKLTNAEIKLKLNSASDTTEQSSKDEFESSNTVLLAEIKSNSTTDKNEASFDFTVKMKGPEEILLATVNVVGMDELCQMAKSNPELLKTLDPETLEQHFLCKVSLKSLDVSVPVKWFRGEIDSYLPFEDEFFEETMDYCNSFFDGATADPDDVDELLCLPYVYAVSGQMEFINVHMHPANPINMQELLEMLETLKTGNVLERAMVAKKLEFTLSNESD